MTTMKRRRHTPGQAVRKVREGERILGSGSELTEVLRHLEITESTWRRWRRASTVRPSAGPRRRRVALRPSCVSGCGTSLVAIHGSGGARLMRALTVRGWFANIIEARAVLENRRVEYNTYRSHQHQPTHP